MIQYKKYVDNYDIVFSRLKKLNPTATDEQIDNKLLLALCGRDVEPCETFVLYDKIKEYIIII